MSTSGELASALIKRNSLNLKKRWRVDSDQDSEEQKSEKPSVAPRKKEVTSTPPQNEPAAEPILSPKEDKVGKSTIKLNIEYVYYYL